MKRALFLLVFLSTTGFAHEAYLSSQHTKINRQEESSWLHTAGGKMHLNDESSITLEGSYLERFSFYEKRFGAGYFQQVLPNWGLGINYLHAFNNPEIFAEDQFNINNFISFNDGLSAFALYQRSQYSITEIDLIRLGLEIEKIQDFIFVPQITLGEARFDEPNTHHNLYQFGLKAIYYREALYSVSVHYFQGNEAAQTIVGRLNKTIYTKNVGLSLGYYINQDLEVEYLFDYLDLGKLNNQFVSSTINLNWSF